MTGDVRTIVKMTVHGMLPGCFIGNWATNSREEIYTERWFLVPGHRTQAAVLVLKIFLPIDQNAN